jgi:phenylacetate-CoA ligase
MTIAAAESTPLDDIRARAAEILAVDRASREELLALQNARLKDLLRHAVQHSAYYREAFGSDASEAALSDLPTLPKPLLMDQFDRIVTDPSIRSADVRRFLAGAGPGDSYRGGYRVFATSGSSGTPGLFLYSHGEFADWIAVGVARLLRVGVGPDTRLIAIGAPGDVHITRQLFAAFQRGRPGVPRLSVETPLPELVAALNGYQPEAVIAYASMLGLLAEEQLEGRLAIQPRVTITTSEVLTEETSRRAESAWGSEPLNTYAATEAPGIAFTSLARVGMHVAEESVVVEVVDGNGHRVDPGCPGSKVLLTNLVNRAQPLIRYELADAVTLAEPPDPAGLPFLRIARVDGRSDDILLLPAADGGTVSVHPRRLCAPFTALVEVRQYQIVHGRDGRLRVRIVPRPTAPTDLPERVRAAVVLELEEAGVLEPAVGVEVVDEIEREPGQAAKVKLVVSEALRAT